MPREYPKGFGKHLVKIIKEEECEKNPIPCLRQKYDYTSYTTDLSLFQNMPLGDTWDDASLGEVYLYLFKNKRLEVPPEWRWTLLEFTKQLQARATCLLTFAAFFHTGASYNGDIST